MIKISEKVVELTKEFFNLEAIFGENACKDVQINKKIGTILINDAYEGVLEYDIGKFATVFDERLNGGCSCQSDFYEYIEE